MNTRSTVPPGPDSPTLPFGLVVYDVTRFMRRAIDQEARALGLSMAQWRTLGHLHRMEGCCQAELAAVLEIAPITLGRLLDRLCAQGMVERRPNPTDRRAFQLFLLPAARPLMQQLWSHSVRVREHAMAGVPPDRQAELLHWLSVVRSNLEAIQPPSSAGLTEALEMNS